MQIVVSSGVDDSMDTHNMMNAHVNSQRLWLHAQGLHGFKQDKDARLRKRSEHKVPVLTMNLFAK